MITLGDQPPISRTSLMALNIRLKSWEWSQHARTVLQGSNICLHLSELFS
jgi:hypothetical protein